MDAKIPNTHADLIKAIAELAATNPQARTVQLYQFALFLKTHPLPTEETFEEIAADEAIWDTQFAATAEDKLAALVAAVEREINEGKVLSMFDEHGEFIEHLMKSQTTLSFWQYYWDLPQEIRQRARQAYKLWRDNQPVQAFSKRVIESQPIYSVRIGLGYRALGLLKGDTVAWFWIGPHHEYERLLR